MEELITNMVKKRKSEENAFAEKSERGSRTETQTTNKGMIKNKGEYFRRSKNLATTRVQESQSGG